MEKDNLVHINYEAECKRLQEQMQADSEFYGQLIEQKDKEIAWYKKIIEGILHV